MSRILLIISLLFVLSCAKDTPTGVFDLSEEANKYKISNDITSFKMIDNNGITDLFRLRNFYTHHNEPWENGFFEVYNIEYQSIINNYYFNFKLDADDYSSMLTLNWNNNDYVYYYFKTEEIETDKIKPNIKFYDSIMVRGKRYYDIIEIDYSKNTSSLSNKTPVKTFISGKEGLIKIVRKDGIFLERID